MSAPHFQILLPAGDTPLIEVTLASLSLQIYPHWEVQIRGRGINADRRAAWQRHLGRCPIRWLGEGAPRPAPAGKIFVLPLLPGDELTPDALADLALVLQSNHQVDLIYADHAEQFAHGDPLTPFFKPAWSPETLVANDYIARAAIRHACLPADALPDAYDAVDLWALWLNMARQEDPIVVRSERVLFRLAPVPRAIVTGQVPRAQAMVEAHLAALGVTGQAVWPEWAIRIGALALDVEFADHGPKVSILVPTKNNFDVFRRCIESLARTTYRDFEIVVIDNASDRPEVLAYLDELRGREGVRVLLIPSPATGFSYSYVNNVAARKVDSHFLLFLNDDTEVIEPRWLSRMVGWGQVPGVASVGAKLYFANDQIQHSGLLHNLLDDALPAPAFKLAPRIAIGVHGQDRIVRNYAAVTAACMLTTRELFLSDGGFDDVDFSVAYNDCDYGFRLSQRGWRHVCVPTAELYHYEGITRGRGRGNDKIAEEVAFIRRYAGWNDPFFNRNLSRESFQFRPVHQAVAPAHKSAGQLTVALFTHNLNYEGAPLVLRDIALGLVRDGMRVVVFSLVDGPLRQDYEAAGCYMVVHADVGVFGARSEGDLRAVLQPIVAEMRMLDIDVALANTVVAHWGVIAAQMSDVPAVWLIHESEPPFSHLEGYGEAHVALARQAFAQSHENVFVANSTRALYEVYTRRNNLRVIYNGFDRTHAAAELRRYDREAVRAELGVSSNDIVFVLPGTVCERKAQQDLLAAIPLLGDAALQSHFIIVGDRPGDYSDGLHAMARALPDSLRSRLTIVPETPDIWRYYAAADAMVFTSRIESFPRVVQEAMYAGLAIVTTPVFGISEQLRDQQSALFFEPGDIAALAAAITRVADDYDLREALARLARISLGRFPTLPVMQETYAALVRAVALAGSGSRQMPSSKVWLSSTEDEHAHWWTEVCGLTMKS